MTAKINYQALEADRTQELQQELEAHLQEEVYSPSGSIDNLRNTVVGYVVAGNYEVGVSEIHRYIEMNSQYPTFKSRTARYVEHCLEIVEAIRMKREFPGMSSLSLSKQQELFEKVKDHFDELKEFLKKIEYIDREMRLDDMKSTVWTVRMVFIVLTVIFFVGFGLDLVNGVGLSISIVFDDIADKVLNLVFG